MKRVFTAPALMRRRQLLDRRRARRFGRDEIDRPADIAERRVHQIGERMDRDRLMRAGNDEALALIREQVGGALGDPFRTSRRGPGQAGKGVGPEHAAAKRRRQAPAHGCWRCAAGGRPSSR